MERLSFSSISTTSWDFERKSDILTYVIDYPTNEMEVKKLSKINLNLFGPDLANLFIKRHNNELQRCSQFYSLASIFNETSSKDKHHTKWNNIKKKYYDGQKYFMKLFRCF